MIHIKKMRHKVMEGIRASEEGLLQSMILLTLQ